MTQLTVHAGVCGFVTKIRAASEDMQSVWFGLESTCPVYGGFRKAVEAAAGLALPRDAGIRFEA